MNLSLTIDTNDPSSVAEARAVLDKLDGAAALSVSASAGPATTQTAEPGSSELALPNGVKLWTTKTRRKPSKAKPGDVWKSEADDDMIRHVMDASGEWQQCTVTDAAALSAQFAAGGSAEPAQQEAATDVDDLFGGADDTPAEITDDDIKSALAAFINAKSANGGDGKGEARSIFVKFGKSMADLDQPTRRQLLAELAV